jgi:hypothetical protein
VIAAAQLLAPRAALGDIFTSKPFEPVFQGMDLEKPANLDKLRPAIRLALARFGWRILSDVEGTCTAEYMKSGGIVRAQIRVVYAASGYRIEYVDSTGMDVDLAARMIHRNYMRWIRNLDKQIYLNYYQ